MSDCQKGEHESGQTLVRFSATLHWLERRDQHLIHQPSDSLGFLMMILGCLRHFWSPYQFVESFCGNRRFKKCVCSELELYHRVSRIFFVLFAQLCPILSHLQQKCKNKIEFWNSLGNYHYRFVEFGPEQAFFLCEIHPSPCKQNAGLTSFGVFKTSFCILKTSFTLSEKQFLSFFKVSFILQC